MVHRAEHMGFLDRVGRFIDDVLLLPDEVREALEVADAALDSELYDEAEAMFLDVLAQRPQLARAAIGLAQARHGLGDIAGTLAALAEARQLVPEDGDLATWQARLALDHGDFDTAARAARDAALARAETGGAPLAEACALAAWAEWRRGRADRAARELRKALSADPDRMDLRVALVEALTDANDFGGARAVAATLEASALEATGALRVGRALLRTGAYLDARVFLEVAAATGEASAQITLARDAIERGAHDEAERLAREAIARGVGADPLGVVGEVLVARGSYSGAAEAFAAAGAQSRDIELLRAAARVAPRSDVEQYLEALDPSDSVRRAVRAWVDGEVVELAEGESNDEPRGLLALAHAALQVDEPAVALKAIAAFDATRSVVDRDEAATIRRDALRSLWTNDGELDLAAAIDAVADFAEEHGLRDVVRSARTLRDELDRPLLLAVLGEFNAGKSTLINAFIGSDVAPMGIVPTTATLNVLRGGAERRVRLMMRDGSTREGTYDSLERMLRDAEALGTSTDDRGNSVDRVEIILPSETLERVWILDAPGTNALDPNHERLATEAARRADAVLWVFDAAQAGKQTETKMHASLRAQGRLIVPVLNKIDRLKPGEHEQVHAVVRKGFGQEPVSISAKKALQARLAADELAYERSGFPALLAHLEATIFSRSRALKHAACAGRLAAALEDALQAETTQAETRAGRRAELERARETLLTCSTRLPLAVDDAVRALESDLDAAFDAAADEVLGFVRPRANRLATHGAHREDRAFLAQLLERRLRAAVEACERRLVARLRGVLDPEDASSLGGRIRSAIRPSLASFWGFQRGVLAGGALAHFFEEVLPRADLEKKGLAGALLRTRADPRTELRATLLEEVQELHRELVMERDQALEALGLEGARLASDVFGPMRALREVLAEASALR